MAKQKRLGSDPLNWIQNSKEQNSVQNKQELINKHELSSKQSKQGSSQKGLPKGWTRATFIVQEEYVEKIRALAYWDRKDIKEVVNEALQEYLAGKNVKAIPK